MVNPYHMGFSIWEQVVEKHGLETARKIVSEEDDFGFVRNYLDRALAEKLGLFVFEAKRDGEIKVATRDIHQVHEAILAPKFNYGSPRIAATELGADGRLKLMHDHASDGRGLDLDRGGRVLDYVKRVWRRPVSLVTTDARGGEVELKRD